MAGLQMALRMLNDGQAEEAIMVAGIPLSTVNMLAVLPAEEDRRSLRGIAASTDWEIGFAAGIEEARRALQEAPFGVVLSEPSVEDGHWEDLLIELSKMANPPPLIVTFRLADERVWAEVLNRGGYDVLLKPLEAREVLRIVDQAWQQWKSRLEQQAATAEM